MFDASYSRAGAESLRRQQTSALKANRAEREAAGITLRQQREQERQLALDRAAEEAKEQAQSGALAVEAHEVQPETAPVDTEASARHMRLGIAAVVVVVCLILWIKQRKGT
ncbi:MAG: hypothetical protein K6G91_05340 [Kiritimatiellae bacterium]|nr:hypothetical protein [Kiritimatiellia bacterium]